ncbi:MAG: hypothetical protein ACP5FK_10565 [bacterium]
MPESEYDPFEQGAFDFIEYTVKPIIEEQGRIWREEEIKVPCFSPIEINGLAYTYEIADYRYLLEEGVFENDIAVRCDGDIVYQNSVCGKSVDYLVYAFFSWENRWIMEYWNHVVIDGIEFNDILGYEKIFCYRIVDGRIFYFYERNSKVYISFDGITQSNQYDYVAHYYCCEPFVLNPEHHESYISFFAIRNGYWYYVEAGVI